jgi:mRNA interferase RelE/StbE
MKCSFRKSFARDLKSIKSDELLARIKAIVEAAETADPITRRQEAGRYEDCYRFRAGDYRIGVVVDKDQMEFVRCLHRWEVYKYFP